MDDLTDANPTEFDRLKAKHRLVRGCHPENLSLRLHRALSWMRRAEIAERETPQDPDAVFIFYWIGFNAAYSEDTDETADTNERSIFSDYFEQIIELDGEGAIFNAIWREFTGPIRLLLDNQYVFQPFWKHHNGVPGYEDWEMRFEESKYVLRIALANTDTHTILATLFDRLYVLRNQLIHGGATWDGSVNRKQVQDGARIMASLVPVFIELMMDNPHHDWGKPYYPVVGIPAERRWDLPD